MSFETRFSQLETGRIRVSTRLFLLCELAFRCCADTGSTAWCLQREVFSLYYRARIDYILSSRPVLQGK